MREPTLQKSGGPKRAGAGAGQPGLAFAAGRTAALDRLIRGGMPRAMAEAWIDAWDESTLELYDFRCAPDFWTQGFRYALEEYQRGYRPQWRPDTSRNVRDPSPQ
jgi:hypothetical protein